MMADAARKQVPPSGKLDPSEVKDERDTSPRIKADTSGERVRAIPAKGGTLVRVTKGDFARNEIDNPTVEFSFRKDNFTLPVGKGQLSAEAANFLTKNFPESFEYINKG
jgi:hypothetical protein